jgi:hypothetical protein
VTTVAFSSTSSRCRSSTRAWWCIALAGVKTSLAKTEALLNIVFGRQIVVPAGQIAESPAFREIFCEVIRPYFLVHRAIGAACEAEGMEIWRPFRLALERPECADYRGYLRSYKFTGAPLLLIESAGLKGADEEGKGRQIEQLIKLFASGRFQDLERALKIPGYELFAQWVRRYVNELHPAIFARPDLPEVSATNYRDMVEAHGELLNRLVSHAMPRPRNWVASASSPRLAHPDHPRKQGRNRLPFPGGRQAEARKPHRHVTHCGSYSQAS